MKRIAKTDLEAFDTGLLTEAIGLSLWVIEYLCDDVNDRFGPPRVADYIVDNLGVSIQEPAVRMALMRASRVGLCHKNDAGFKIMRLGQEELLRRMGMGGVILLEPDKPFVAGVQLGNIFSKMKGKIMINDPYVDHKTLDVIHRHFSDTKPPIRLLTVNVADGARFKRDIEKLVTERFDIEARKMKPGTIHDRWFADDRNLWISGNSLNNLGKKESFILMLGEGMRQTVASAFDARWQSAVAV